ncbi:hypothetical protein GCM10010129_84530 [Streptomyces fumigatiscleroticus]|nr:hypothetical protein GCM10010129_84530 [Streptomyces fumigatiscleroticus]
MEDLGGDKDEDEVEAELLVAEDEVKGSIAKGSMKSGVKKKKV